MAPDGTGSCLGAYDCSTTKKVLSFSVSPERTSRNRFCRLPHLRKKRICSITCSVDGQVSRSISTGLMILLLEKTEVSSYRRRRSRMDYLAILVADCNVSFVARRGERDDKGEGGRILRVRL